ncbi:MurR/RpiR family transcriptional regulator [Prauserella sp. PE36]|uniref:MurR/RpiR family transcriptional regulator n=1 Tax=Prauserella endophytica TaxID=1592324 RepID=A0ABY2S5E1_9PSEU|nr:MULTISPECIES: MurR/RpiR family transcriptional regulator [Prauserella]RBM12564.1 MurR/RpiR family transcriptional regulator [Prauserella sp. PE36]TKG71090.1 MurR/RpiR family transcriptional regulator [Prauserella endophytica]
MTTDAPATFDELAGRLQRTLPELSRSHRLLAERVLADPEGVAFMTVSDLASAVGVNEATVVRFATAVGFKGFPELKRVCRERLREQAQLLRRFDSLEQRGDGGGGWLPRQAAELDSANIARTFARLDDASWDATVRLLAEAPRVHVLGLRKCHAPAYLLGYLLRMVREDAETITGEAGSLTDSLRRVRDGDAFVAISIHRYSADTVRATEWASKRGARCVALTDNASSPLVPLVEQAFFVDAAGPAVLRSVTAFTALTQALVAGVAQVLGHEVRDTLLRDEALLDEFGVYEQRG